MCELTKGLNMATPTYVFRNSDAIKLQIYPLVKDEVIQRKIEKGRKKEMQKVFDEIMDILVKSQSSTDAERYFSTEIGNKFKSLQLKTELINLYSRKMLILQEEKSNKKQSSCCIVL